MKYIELRAQDCVWWPRMYQDIQDIQDGCKECICDAPSQASVPLVDPPMVEYPFQWVCEDYMEVSGYHYLVVVDQFLGWPVVFRCNKANEMVKFLQWSFVNFGISEEFSSDGGSQFVTDEFQEFLKTWGIRHRLSSAYNPHSNNWAEVGVKYMKRLLRNNWGPGRSLDTDAFLRATMEYRNTPDHDTGCSPSEVVFGCPI